MYRKDYILRMIHTLIDALKEIIAGIQSGNIEEAKLKIDKSYEMLGQNVRFFLDNSIDDILDFFESSEEQIAMDKLNLLSKIMYYDSLVQENKSSKEQFLKKAIEILEYHIDYSKEYSFGDIGKLQKMKSELKQ
ncbi:hypothetical protein [Wenyingzhuangia sp. IMCC45574]